MLLCVNEVHMQICKCLAKHQDKLQQQCKINKQGGAGKGAYATSCSPLDQPDLPSQEAGPSWPGPHDVCRYLSLVNLSKRTVMEMNKSLSSSQGQHSPCLRFSEPDWK